MLYNFGTDGKNNTRKMQIILLKILVHYYYLRKWTKCSASFILLRFQCTCIVVYALLPIQCIIERVAHTERKNTRHKGEKIRNKNLKLVSKLIGLLFPNNEKRNVCKSVLGLRKSRLFPLNVFFHRYSFFGSTFQRVLNVPQNYSVLSVEALISVIKWKISHFF